MFKNEPLNTGRDVKFSETDRLSDRQTDRQAARTTHRTGEIPVPVQYSYSTYSTSIRYKYSTTIHNLQTLSSRQTTDSYCTVSDSGDQECLCLSIVNCTVRVVYSALCKCACACSSQSASMSLGLCVGHSL